MDDFPASPASPRPRRPRLSVVIPVNNGGRDFERCLRGLRDSSCTDYELLVVDDGSTDDSAQVAERFGAQVFRNHRKLGPAAARNHGVLAAQSPLIFFIDADVAVHPQAIDRAIARLDANPQLAALFGSYDDSPAARGLVSQFRNLLHHYVHQSGTFENDVRPAHTFWTGCSLIRREVFLEAGGFDPQLYQRPAIEDIELGYRITRAGQKILLARDVLATHLKKWTLREMIKTDIFRRGVPWMLLMKRSRIVETDLNVSQAQRACVAVTGLGLIGLVGGVWWPWLFALFPLALGAIVALNQDFYRFLARRKGRRFALGSTWLHLLYYCCCGASVLIAQGICWFTRASAELPQRSSRGSRLDQASGPSLSSPHPTARQRRSRTR